LQLGKDQILEPFYELCSLPIKSHH